MICKRHGDWGRNEAGMRSCMSSKTILPSKSLLAQGTLKWRFFRMSSFMSFKVVCLAKCLIAIPTILWPLCRRSAFTHHCHWMSICLLRCQMAARLRKCPGLWGMLGHLTIQLDQRNLSGRTTARVSPLTLFLTPSPWQLR